MVQTLQIVLFTIDDVKRFVTLTNKYHFPINLSNGKYKIDAKSIMGVSAWALPSLLPWRLTAILPRAKRWRNS